MTIGMAIETLDALVYNQIEESVKVRWLSELDGVVHREILQTHAETAGRDFSGYDGSTDMGTPLLVPPPYDRVYEWYLEMQVFDTLGEITRYNNAARKYNTALLAYADQVNRVCTPLGARSLGLV